MTVGVTVVWVVVEPTRVAGVKVPVVPVMPTEVGTTVSHGTQAPWVAGVVVAVVRAVAGVTAVELAWAATAAPPLPSSACVVAGVEDEHATRAAATIDVTIRFLIFLLSFLDVNFL